MKELEVTRKRTRDDEKGRKLDMMIAEMSEMKKMMKKKSAATIITKALKETNDDDVKKKLRAKLVQIALDLD